MKNHTNTGVKMKDGTSLICPVCRKVPKGRWNKTCGCGTVTIDYSTYGVKQPPLPPRPTGHAPGTPGKIEEMVWRAEHGYHIHHPRDAGYGSLS